MKGGFFLEKKPPGCEVEVKSRIENAVKRPPRTAAEPNTLVHRAADFSAA
jgi:hypothetical protein